MSNPRFPHICSITRSEGDIQAGEIITTLVYSGSCRKELNNYNNANPNNSASTAQWLLSLPISCKLAYGDKVTLDDGIAEISGTVSDWATTNIEHYNSDGTFTKDKDGNITSLDGTTTKGLHVFVSISKN